MKQQAAVAIREALKEALVQLRVAGVPSHTLAAELLLMHALGRDRAWLYAHPEEEIPAEAAARFLELVSRRVNGEPTQYLTGKQEFWDLEFEVTPDVLIPRPETEHVIEVALDRLALRELRAGRAQKTLGEGLQIADIGTGSGCIAVALARELPQATVYATDISGAALKVARRNAKRHGVADRIRFVQCNLLESLAPASPHTPDSPGQFDLIVSNPPYVARRSAATLPREVREHEPETALYGGEEGYEIYAAVVAQATRHLKPEGLLVLELGFDSLPIVQPLLDPAAWTRIGVTQDLAGFPRVIAAERTSGSL
jgi:release factor glutamine methyltransferase